jgi:hypothetical protein
MAIMALRDFECTLCRERFTLLSGDLILPVPVFCDECLRELWPLEGDALREYVAQRMVEQPPGEGQRRARPTQDQVIQAILALKQRSRSIQEIIRDREAERRAF